METILVIIGFVVIGVLITIKGVKECIDGEPLFGSIVMGLGVMIGIGIILISTV